MASDELPGHDLSRRGASTDGPGGAITDDPGGTITDGPDGASAGDAGAMTDDGGTKDGAAHDAKPHAIGRAARSLARRLPPSAGRWLSIFAVSLGLFSIRFLIPTPVGQADNHDGRRVMCAFGVAPVTGGFTRWVSYAYFQFVPSASCAKIGLYPSSQLVLVGAARLLTPLMGLAGTVNLIALGLLTCAIASFGIATLATGLRLRLWAQLTAAAVAWLIMADAAFFDLYASPFNEPAVLIGLLLVAAGLVYLGRGWRETVFGLVVAGAGGLAAIGAKEQYVILAVPICLAIVLAGQVHGAGRGLRRFLTRQTVASVGVAAVLGLTTSAYLYWDSTSSYAAVLHHEQAVDMIFVDIVNGHDNARSDLRALGLPASWARYAGHDFFSRTSVWHDPLYARYAGKLSDANIAHFLLTHPGRIAGIGQRAARYALHFRVTYLGDFPPSAGHPAGAVESRVAVLTWLVKSIPAGYGLWWLVPMWAIMAAIAIAALVMRPRRPWRRDGAVVAACMTGCAIAAFIPPAFFEGIATTRHMVGSNLASALAVLMSSALAISMAREAVVRPPGYRKTTAGTTARSLPATRSSGH
ncbi:MAG TPA: hypothetical protein VN840_11170 [Streptosporangiaceae bacterium]|nr:hypothetical protein [Streptosporangiaceae bacterium]